MMSRTLHSHKSDEAVPRSFKAIRAVIIAARTSSVRLKSKEKIIVPYTARLKAQAGFHYIGDAVTTNTEVSTLHPLVPPRHHSKARKRPALFHEIRSDYGPSLLQKKSPFNSGSVSPLQRTSDTSTIDVQAKIGVPITPAQDSTEGDMIGQDKQFHELPPKRTSDASMIDVQAKIGVPIITPKIYIDGNTIRQDKERHKQFEDNQSTATAADKELWHECLQSRREAGSVESISETAQVQESQQWWETISRDLLIGIEDNEEPSVIPLPPSPPPERWKHASSNYFPSGYSHLGQDAIIEIVQENKRKAQWPELPNHF
jgi:hypothetical protein